MCDHSMTLSYTLFPHVVNIGLEFIEYTVLEGTGPVTVCLEIFEGQLASTVEISADISTGADTAFGK